MMRDLIWQHPDIFVWVSSLGMLFVGAAFVALVYAIFNKGEDR